MMTAQEAWLESAMKTAIRYDEDGMLWMWQPGKLAVAISEELFELRPSEEAAQHDDWQPAMPEA